MPKPSIADILTASGFFEYTPELITRAINVLYGNIGSNTDERNWALIMQSGNPLATAEAALRQQWQSADYLLRNAQALTANGQPDFVPEYTYRQMAQRLGYTYQTFWSQGTPFAITSAFSDAALNAVAAAYAESRSNTSIRFTASEAGISIVLGREGVLSYSVSGLSEQFPAGSTPLLAGATGSLIREGRVTLTQANGYTSTSSAWLYVGNNAPLLRDFGEDVPALRDRVLVLGSGPDNVGCGDGSDTVHAGDGDDTVFGNQGNDLIYGGNGRDFVQAGQGDDTVFGGPGDDNLWGGTTGNDWLDGGPGQDTLRGQDGTDTLLGGADDDIMLFIGFEEFMAGGAVVDLIDGGSGFNTLRVLAPGFTILGTDSFARVSNMQALAVGASTNPFSITLNANAFTTAGLRSVSLAADVQAQGANLIDASAAPASHGGLTLTGSSGDDTIRGGAGGDTLVGGPGVDVFMVSSGTDTILDAGFGGEDEVVVSVGATAVISVPSSAQVPGAPNGHIWSPSSSTSNNGVATVTVQDGAGGVHLAQVSGNSGWTVQVMNIGTVTGSPFNDTLIGSNGYDYLGGGMGADRITTGGFSDSIAYIMPAEGGDTITDFSAGTGVFDTDVLCFGVGSAPYFSVGNLDASIVIATGSNAALNVPGVEVAIKTDATVENNALSAQAVIDAMGLITSGALFLFSDGTHAHLWYDPNPSVPGGGVHIATLLGISLAGLTSFNATHFLFVAV